MREFFAGDALPVVQLAPLKQCTKKAPRKAGRLSANSTQPRVVQLDEPQYVAQLQTMATTLKTPLERRNAHTGRMKEACLRTITYRHSYAMLILYAGIPLKVLQSRMGHKSISATEMYTRVFMLDVAAWQRAQFSMPEAVTILKGRR
ncbi:site-specific tyrosine recombinase XerD [Serratia quinivorans]|nr:site-specific tyrosine recombinase XerD [Serratia quinivorans]CAI1122713.1 site-specific tyrosine recombinase XerD [Serratia entomophila]CAI1973611.1 site-specific tyrosine recombinase XerD [Serratia proteamaculans]CAI1032177.1 site-specific tyrosine recombinase XerD [Serratia quinivorans]CAI1035056.1 site-specific tyrosine recombinase XerD [Serratia quinivorans]